MGEHNLELKIEQNLQSIFWMIFMLFKSYFKWDLLNPVLFESELNKNSVWSINQMERLLKGMKISKSKLKFTI